MTRRFVLVLSAVLAVLVVVTVSLVVLLSGPGKPSPPTIVLVHGYSLTTGCPGSDVQQYWSGLTSVLAESGITNRVDEVSYYECDTGGSDIGSAGTPSAYFASGEIGTAGGTIFTQNTDIRHLGYALAWYLYTTYSEHGQSVDVVAHSMGGLMIRWALAQVAAHEASFPPFLLVRDAVTISSPFDGAISRVESLPSCVGSLQCAQFAAGSSFLAQLDANPDPQGRGGTAWTAMGGGPCDLMSAASATDITAYRISWLQPCYTHAGIIMDQSGAVNAVATMSDPGGTPSTDHAAQHSLAAVVTALQRAP